jgi:hypothetical protein
VSPPADDGNANRDLRTIIAAHDYIAARVALMGAVAGTMLDATIAVDVAYHELVLACGVRCEDVGCWHSDDATTLWTPREDRT